jgi:nucleoside-diphosphate-sugar epimerase
MKILVTGGRGFVGRALIPVLTKAGHTVVATSRKPDTTIPGASVCPIGELGPVTDWSQALSDVDAVVHLAARVHIMKERTADPLAENRRINTEGTRKLAKDATRAGVQRFVFLSTIKVNGEVTVEKPFHAKDTPAPQDPYAIAKLEAEQALIDIAAQSDMSVAIIRPPLVYGPGVRGNFLSLLKLCAKAWPLPLGSIHNSRSLIYIGNLADLVLRVVEKQTPDTAVYLCRDSEEVSTPGLIRHVGTALGRVSILLPVPPSLLRFAGRLSGKSGVISRLNDSLVVDDNETRNDLDWTPPFSMLQGLKETVAWFNHRPKN